MRKPHTGAIAGVAGVLFLSALAAAQDNAARSPWKYYPMERAIGDGGPAPKRDLTGTWAGPASGAAVPRGKTESPPPLTPLGKQSYERNKPLGKYSPGGTNDPHSRYCDPFGFPQNMTQEIRGMTITTLPNRTFILLQYMDVWREVWTDGRTLPSNVGGTARDSSIRSTTNGTRWGTGRTTTRSWWIQPGSPRRPGPLRVAIRIASMPTCRNAFTGTARTI